MFQAVITALPILVLEVDDEGIILEFNSDSPSQFDIKLNTYLSNHISTIIPDQVHEEVETALQEIKKGEKPSLINYSMKLEDGDHWFEVRFISSNKKSCIVIIQDITQYKMHEQKIQKQLDQLSALRAIDRVITSSVDLNLTLSILLTELVKQLQIDTACILLWNDDSERLEYVAGLGFRTKALSHTKLRLGEGYAGVAALEQRVVQVKDLSTKTNGFLRSPTFDHEDFVSYFAVPLIAKGEVKGVLEIFNRTMLEPGSDWLDFLEMLAGQAAIAMDNAYLYNSLQQTNAELISAYDATIEGWSRALELRDNTAKGHTQRVTEMAISLARRLDIPVTYLRHIQRGATLHDIGKMGIPDHILHKPGPLTDEEWKIMRRHPKFAHDLLSPIEYLRPAKDIPCKHHERWNGSGYPYGLKGKEIPLAARLFAIVDVYDTLTCDRPYRHAWSKKAAKIYIQDQAGKMFDPDIVPVFLNLVSEMENGLLKFDHFHAGF